MAAKYSSFVGAIGMVVLGCGGKIDADAKRGGDASSTLDAARDAPIVIEASATGGSAGFDASSTGGIAGSVSTGGLAGVDAGPACPSPNACVPSLPADWLGPIALAIGSTDTSPSECAGDYAAEAFLIRNAPNAPPATCNCNCTPGILGCSGYRVNAYDSPTCAGTTCNSRTMFPGVCEESIGGTLCGEGMITTADVVGACTAQEATVITAPKWDQVMRGCLASTNAPGSCLEGLCLPPLPSADSKLCIYRSGVHDCPIGTFNEKHDGYGSFQDTRSCSGGCTCTPKCGTVTYYSDGACLTPILTTEAPGDCSGPGMRSAKVTSSPHCQSNQESKPTGELALSDAMTVCCSPSK